MICDVSILYSDEAHDVKFLHFTMCKCLTLTVWINAHTLSIRDIFDNFDPNQQQNMFSLVYVWLNDWASYLNLMHYHTCILLNCL